MLRSVHVHVRHTRMHHCEFEARRIYLYVDVQYVSPVIAVPSHV